MTPLINRLLGKKEEPIMEDKPEFKQTRKYKLCIEDNPDETKYCCGRKEVVVPTCEITLKLEELTTEDVRTIELEIMNLLERNGFVVR